MPCPDILLCSYFWKTPAIKAVLSSILLMKPCIGVLFLPATQRYMCTLPCFACKYICDTFPTPPFCRWCHRFMQMQEQKSECTNGETCRCSFIQITAAANSPNCLESLSFCSHGHRNALIHPIPYGHLKMPLQLSDKATVSSPIKEADDSAWRTAVNAPTDFTAMLFIVSHKLTTCGLPINYCGHIYHCY